MTALTVGESADHTFAPLFLINAAGVNGNHLTQAPITVADARTAASNIISGAPIITGVTLIDSYLDKELGDLTPGGDVDLEALSRGRFSLRAELAGEVAQVQLVRFTLTGADQHSQDDRNAPYSLFNDAVLSDGSIDYRHRLLPVGDYQLVIELFGDRRGSSAALDTLTMQFVVAEGKGSGGDDGSGDDGSGDPNAGISGFTLIDSYLDQALGPLNNGDSVNLNALSRGRFTVRAEIADNSKVELVRFTLTGAQGHQQDDRIAPYSLFNDYTRSDGSVDYRHTQLPVGSYQLLVELFAGRNGSSAPLATRQLTFTVSDGNTPPPPPPAAATLEVTAIELRTGQGQRVGALATNDTIDLADLPEGGVSLHAVVASSGQPAKPGVAFTLTGPTSASVEDDSAPYQLALALVPGEYQLSAVGLSDLADPNSASAAYALSFSVIDSSDDGNNDGLRQPDQPASELISGLAYRYYQGSFEGTIPNPALHSSLKLGFTDSVTIDLREQESHYGLLFNGYFNAPVDGSYTFTLRSDDGSLLWFGEAYDPASALVDNDGYHPPETVAASIDLKAGLHAMGIGFFQGGGGHLLEATVTLPDGTTRPLSGDLLRVEDNWFDVMRRAPDRTSTDGLIPGLAFKSFEVDDIEALPDFDALTPVLEGDIANVSTAPRLVESNFVIRFEGYLQILQSGDYRFYTTSDDGSRLWIGDELVVDNDGLHSMRQEDGVISLRAGLHAIAIDYFNHYGGWGLAVSYEGGDIDSETPIPTSALFHQQVRAPIALEELVDCGSGPAQPVVSQTDAVRLLTQASFGPTVEEVHRVQCLGIEAWLDEQLAAAPCSHFAHLNNYVEPKQEHRIEAWWGCALRGSDQLRQRVAFALSEIFVVSQNDGNLRQDAVGLTHYYDLLSQNAFGSYRQLLEEVTLSPVMGLYLSMLRNAKPDPAKGTSPDENYAREVLQLFSVGKWQLNDDGSQIIIGGEPVPTYDQDVITGFAHAFTGWTYGDADRFSDKQGSRTLPMKMFGGAHDTGSKLLLEGITLPSIQEYYGLSANQAPTDQQLDDYGVQDLAAALDVIAGHPNVAPFIGRQLIQRLVSSNPSPDYIQRVSNAFNTSGGNLGATVRAILLDPEARDASYTLYSDHGKIREPLLMQTAIWRLFEAEPRPSDEFPDPATAPYRYWYPERAFDQAPLRSPSVFNFFDPSYQHPGAVADNGLYSPELQIATDLTVISVANQFYTTIFRGVKPYAHYGDNTIWLDLSPLYNYALQPSVLVEWLNRHLMAGQLSAATRAEVLGIISHPERSLLARIQEALYLLVTSPEFAVQR